MECRTKKGCSPLFLACKEGYKEISVMLAKHGADTEVDILLYSDYLVIHCTVVPCHVLLYHDMVPCTLCHVMYCGTMSCAVVPCRVLWYHVVYCGTMSCTVVPCRVLWYHVVYCGTMSCTVVPCHVPSCADGCWLQLLADKFVVSVVWDTFIVHGCSRLVWYCIIM